MVTLPSGFSNVLNTFKAIAGNVASTFGIQNSWSSSFTANTGSTALNKLVTTVAESPFITAGVAAGGITAVQNAGTVASSLIPASTGGKIAAALAVPVVAGAVMKQPIEAATAAVSLPSGLVNFGGNIAEFASNPSLEGAKNIVKENPLISAGAVAGAVAAVGLGAATLGASLLNTAATKANTQAIKITTGSSSLEETKKLFEAAGQGEAFKAAHPELYPTQAAVSSTPELPKTPQTPVAAPVPITPPTQTVEASSIKSSTTRRKRATGQIKGQNISQRVNILLNTGRFINARRLRY